METGTGLPPHGIMHSHGTKDDPHRFSLPSCDPPARPLRVGLAGPIGSGKTTLLIELVRAASSEGVQCAVVTNDVYTRVDAEIIGRTGVIAASRLLGIATGGCPHTAIRDDVTLNDQAVRDLVEANRDTDIVFIESGGDNLTTTFSRELVHRWICVIDVGAGDKIPSKGGPGITDSDLLVVNKTDIALQVHASLERFRTDLAEARGESPFEFVTDTDPATSRRVWDLVRTWMPVA